MIQVDMSASTREKFGKCAMRRLRVSGNTPAILYGNDKDTTALQLETTPFLKTLFQISRTNAVVNLSINGGDNRQVMMKEIQTDPVDDALIHADFFEINLDLPRAFAVIIDFNGLSKGVDLGGSLLVHNAKVMVEGLPLDIPDSVSIDITDLDIGDTVAFSALELPGNVKMLSAGSALCLEVLGISLDEDEEDDEVKAEPVTDTATEE